MGWSVRCTPKFSVGIRYAPTWNLTFSRISKFKNCTDQIVWFFALLSILYGVWFIALMKRHFMKNGIFLLLIFVWIISGPLIRTQFRFFFLFSRCQLLLCMSKKETIRSIAYIFWIEFWHLNLNWLDRKWKTLVHAIIHNFCRFRLTRCSGSFFGRSLIANICYFRTKYS